MPQNKQNEDSEANAPATRPIRCRNCGASLVEAAVDHRLNVITCAHCGGLHELTRKVAAGSSAARSDEARGIVPLPRRFAVRRGKGTLSVNWPTGGSEVELTVMGFGTIFTFLFFAEVSFSFLVALPICVLFYYLAKLHVNHTTLVIDDSHLSVSSGPMPWPGVTQEARHIPLDEIKQIFGREQISPIRVNDMQIRRYSLIAIGPEGSEQIVVRGLARPGYVLWLEREIEDTIGIADESVFGEYG